MSGSRISVWWVVLLGSFCGCLAEGAERDFTGDERAVREIEKQLAQAVSARGLGRLLSFYADDAALYYEDHPALIGKHAIREKWKAVISKPGFSMTLEPLQVQVASSGALAFAHGTFETTITHQPGKTVRGEYAVVYMRQPDARWKIIADNSSRAVGPHSLPRPGDKKPSSLIPVAIGSLCLMSGVWFLIGMPIALSVSAWKSYHTRQLTTAFLACGVMFIAFLSTAVLLWRHLATYYWNLSFLTAFEAAGDAANYGHPMEHTAEVLIVNLLIFSTLSAVGAGIIAATLRYLWRRRATVAIG